MSERTELIEWCERMYGDAECGYHFQQQLRRIARMLREPAASREVQEPQVIAAARAAIKARDTFGWSTEADAALEKLRAALSRGGEVERG